MNIRQAIYECPNEMQTVDSYYGRIMIEGRQKTFIPVDFRLSKGVVSVPLKSGDISFVYDVKENKTSITKGDYELSRYYPVGTILNIENLKLKVTGYGECYTVGGKIRVPIFTVCLNEDMDNYPEIISNKSIEEFVKRHVENILISNDTLKKKLSHYKYDFLDYTEENIGVYEECESLRLLTECKGMESSEYEYRMNNHLTDLKSTDIDEETMKKRYIEFMARVNYEKMRVKYNRGSIVYNMISICKWILFHRRFKGNLYLQTCFKKDFCKLNVYPSGTNVIIEVLTPDYAFYNYRFELINVVKCMMFSSYFEYIMDNLKVYAIGKGASSEIELVNLRGIDPDIPDKRRLMPIVQCEYDPWNCINNCPPWACLDPIRCKNKYHGDGVHCDHHHHHHHGRPIPDPYDTEDIQDTAYINGYFYDTYFNIFVDLLRLVCGSYQSFKASNAKNADEFYAIMNTLIINKVNEYIEEMDDDGIYANNADEFRSKYAALLVKSVDSIVLADEPTVVKALDEYVQLPSTEQSKLLDEKAKLDAFDDRIKYLKMIDDKSYKGRSFFTVDDIAMRDAIPKSQLVNGRIVKVNDNGQGKVAYYSWDAYAQAWVEEDFVSDDMETTIDTINGSILWNEFGVDGM